MRREIASAVAIASPIAILCLPVHVCFGPFGDAQQSRAYLNVAWQVVAAALGVTVAIIAVLFSALLAGTARTVGISLLDFARGSGMMAVVRLGISTLVVDGLVLLPLGHGAPAGWAGFVAAVMSGSTLVSVLWVFERSVVSVDPRGLVQLRIRKLLRAAQSALHLQLMNRAAEQFLERDGPSHAIGRMLSAAPADRAATAKRDAEVRDVRLGRLRRLITAEAHRGSSIEVRLLGLSALGHRVQAGDAVVALNGAATERATRRARRAIKLRRPRQTAEIVLREDLEGLHRQALTAIREADREVWDLIADAYEEVLLALPRAAARYGLPFAGAVASPGIFRLGPLDSVQRYFYEEIEAAVRAGDRSLALDVAYLPMRIARRAAPLDAPALVRAMLDLYPSLYLLAQEAPR